MEYIKRICYYIANPIAVINRLTRKSATEIAIEELKDILPKAPLIIEAGASRGTDTMVFSNTWREARIFAFEPVSVTFEELESKCQGRDNITTFKAALAEEDGISVINISSRQGDELATDSSSLLEPDREYYKDNHDLIFSKKEEIKTVRLDTFIAEREIERVDFMWLDMQGYELKMLQGSRAALAKVDRIYMEVYNQPTYQGAPTFKQVKREMKELGFYVEKKFVGYQGGNALFKNSKT